MVKEGTTIDIYQSIGKKKFEMSDYTGRRYDDVIRILENKSFKDISKMMFMMIVNQERLLIKIFLMVKKLFQKRQDWNLQSAKDRNLSF